MKIKLLALILSAVLVVGGGTTLFVVSNTPQSVALNAISGAIEDFANREEIAPLIGAFTEGSVEFSAENIVYKDKDILDGGSISGKSYFAKNSFYLEDFKLAFDNKSVNASVYISEDTFFIKESDIFDASIGINKGSAAKDFEDSIFAFGSESDYALDEKATKAIVSLLEAYDNAEVKKLKKDGEKIFKQYFKEFYKIVCDNAEFESEFDEIKLNGDRTKVRLITITFDADSVSNIASDFYDFLCEDDKLPKHLEKYEETFRASFENLGYDDEDESLSELYEKLLDDLDEEMDSIENSIETIFGNSELVIEIATPHITSTLLKINAYIDDGEDDYELFSFDFGSKGVAKTDMMTFTIDGDSLVYEIDRDGSKEVEATFSFNDEEILTLTIDKDDETYEIASPDDEFVISGKISTKKKSTTITIEEIEVEGDTKITADIEIIINQKEKMPDVSSNFDTLDEITEEDIEGWKNKLLKALGLSGDANEDDIIPELTPDDEYWTGDY